jgi:MFS family permease
LFTFSVVRRNPSQPAAATGIAMTGIYVGAATGPVVFGIVAERISFRWGGSRWRQRWRSGRC